MDLFNSLPPQLQRRIDRAFALKTEPSPDIDQQSGLYSQIPLSFIPSALQSLDLPPDDEQVLSVFRKAASGWTVSSGDVFDGKQDEWMVSRDDWRSVCAVLFESHEEDHRRLEFDGLHDSDGEMEYEEQLLTSGSTDDGSVDEYLENPVTSSSHRQSKHEPEFSCTSASSPAKNVSLRQQQACLEAFALFFPSVPTSEVAKQKIMMKDIQRVSELLGEKIKANEMIEMLEMFATSVDKSIDLRDFSRMMVAAKLT